MKRTIYPYIITLLLSLTSISGWSQGITVFEHNGTQTNIPTADFDCIVPDAGVSLKGIVVKRTDGTSFKVSASQLDSIITYAQSYDERLTYSIPEEYVNKMGQHMPIYNGNTPPNIEGAYNFSPNIAIYFEDYPSQEGKEYESLIMRFENQDEQKNKLDYSNRNPSSTTFSSCTGAAIIGEGNNFTCFFISEGESSGISTKTATLLSGTKTASGIKNMYYGFVLLDKGDDPDNILMNKGVCRILKDGDGIASTTSWANQGWMEDDDEPLELPSPIEAQ